MNNSSQNRALLLKRVERFVHGHGYSCMPLGAVSTIASSSRDEAHDEGLFRAAYWALENIKHDDEPYRIYHHGDYLSLYSLGEQGSAPGIARPQLRIEQFNGRTPCDDAALMMLAFKILQDLGYSECMLRIGNVDILAQLLKSQPYSVKHEVLRDLEELSQLDDAIHHSIERYGSRSGNDTNVSGTNQHIFELCDCLVNKIEQKFGANRTGVNRVRNDHVTAVNIKELFDKFKQLYVEEKWYGTCGLPERVGKSLSALLTLKWLGFDEAQHILISNPDFIENGAAVDLLKQVVECLRTFPAKDFTESQIALDLCLSYGLGHYTGIVFEIGTLENSKLHWLCRGGRYDSLVADLAQRVDVSTDHYLAGLIDVSTDIPANGFSICVSDIEDATKLASSDTGGPRLAPWIRSVNVITPATARGEAEALADRLRLQFPGLAVPVYELMAAMKPTTHELSITLKDDWEPKKDFKVFQRVPGDERSWELDERRLKSFLDVDSRCRLRGGPEE